MTMKKFGLIAWFFIFILAACQSGSNTENKDITPEDIARSVEITHIAEIEVEGMTCEMGCGGDIRKALRGTGGVAKVDFDFEDDRQVNIARVQFDSQTVEAEEMKKVILGLNKGQFKVGNIETKVMSKPESSTEKSGNKESGSGVQMKNSMLSLSDFVGIVASWFL
jgi:copper chaperone CopZ